MSVPDKFYAGDTLEFGVNVPDFPPSDGWTLKYKLTPRSNALADISALTATSNGTIDGVTYDYVITATPATTANWAAGAYGWSRWVEKSGARQTLDDLLSRGQLTILANPATAAPGVDNRTQAQKAVDDLKAILATSTAAGEFNVAEYEIAGRRVKYSERSEVVKALQFWMTELARENRAARLAAGLGSPRNVYVRANRV